MSKLLQFFEKKWALISSTVIVCGAIFAFFYARMVELKNQEVRLKDEQIHLLEKQAQNLSNAGTVSNVISNLNSNFQSLERRVSAVLVMTTFDPYNGGAVIGGADTAISFGTPLNVLLTNAVERINQKK